MCELQLCWAAQIYREFSKYVYVCFKNEKIQGSLAALLDLAMVKSHDKTRGGEAVSTPMLENNIIFIRNSQSH